MHSRPPGFYKGQMSGKVLTAEGYANGGAVAGMGESGIGSSALLTGNVRERAFNGAPRFWHVTNRAEKGHVKVWRDTFDGEAYPEGATGDKSTWLQPGESMTLPLEAALHFFGNIFHPALPDCDHIIERTGGFEMETRASEPGRSPQTRIIGPPIGLPDLVIQPQDGRNRNIGEPVSLYDLYWNKTKNRVRERVGHEPAVLADEKSLLESRLDEYRFTPGEQSEHAEAAKPTRSRG
jgi:hypothetical protein